MQNFKVGERVQVIEGNQLKTGKIEILNYCDGDDDDDIVAISFNKGDSDWYWGSRAGVAKLDQPKPVEVPKMIANFIESYDNTMDRYNILAKALEFLSDVYNESNEVDEWIDNNMTQFIRAVIDGYVVEEEQKYYVRLPFAVWDEEAAELVNDYNYLAMNPRTDEVMITESMSLSVRDIQNGFTVFLTEEQVKSDERYWAFAVPVEEVEASK